MSKLKQRYVLYSEKAGVFLGIWDNEIRGCWSKLDWDLASSIHRVPTFPGATAAGLFLNRNLNKNVMERKLPKFKLVPVSEVNNDKEASEETCKKAGLEGWL
jgi:hypothetical protein